MDLFAFELLINFNALEGFWELWFSKIVFFLYKSTITNRMVLGLDSFSI